MLFANSSFADELGEPTKLCVQSLDVLEVKMWPKIARYDKRTRASEAGVSCSDTGGSEMEVNILWLTGELEYVDL